MFKAYVNGVLFYDDSSSQENLKVLSPVLDVEESSAGSFKFTVPPTNIKYGAFVKVTSVVTIKKLNSNNIYWEGRVVDISEDFWKCQTVTCEGSLAYLNDTIQPNASYSKKTPKEFVEILLAAHNSKVNNSKKILLGSVSISDTTKVDRYTNFETTFDLIKKQVETSGGHVNIRYASGNRYLDWSDTYSSSTTQRIEFGENLLDYSSNMSIDDFCTVLIPQGAKLEDTEGDFDEYLDVKSVNGGSIYVSLTAGDYQTPPSVLPIDAFGRLELVKRWEDITQPTNLLLRAKRYLLDQQFDKMRLEISAFDLKYADASYEEIELLDKVQVVSAPHGLNKAFPVTKMSIPLDTPEDTKFTLGGEVNRDSTLTGVTRSSSSSLSDKIDEKPSEAKITRKYKEDISYEIEKHTKGYVNIITNDSGSQEFVISDTPNYLTASRIWRWTLNGLAFSKNGYNQGPYEVALTADGQINANMISTGVLNADLIKAGILQDQNGGENFSLNLETGELHIKMVSDLNDKLNGIGTTNMILNTLNPAVTPAADRPRIRGQVLNTTFSTGTAETTDHGVTVINTGAVRPYVRFGANSITAEQAGLNGLIPGKTYTFSCDARWNLFIPGASGTNGAFTVNLVTNAANPDVFSTTFTYPTPILPEQFGVDMIGRVEFTFTVPETATKLYLWATGNIATASTYQAGNFISLANIKLETGQVATDWSPAPEDMEGYTRTQIDISANAIKTEMSTIYETKTDSTTKIGTAKTEAINAAAADATSKATAAKDAANSYTDGKLTSYSTTAEMETALTQTVEGIESRAAAKYTTKEEFDDLSIGGKNLLPDSDAPTLAATYKPNGATTSTSRYFSGTHVSGATYEWIPLPGDIPAPPISAENCAHYIYPAAASYANALAWCDCYVPMVAGQTYTLSGWFYVKSGGIRVQLQYGVSPYKRKDYTIMRAGGTWVRHSWTFVADASCINPGDDNIKAWTRIYVGCANIKNEIGEAYVTGFQLEIGNRATAWNPYTQDLKTRVDKAETTITQNSEQILLRATKEEAQNYASTAENAAITAAAADATTKANNAISTAAADATSKANAAKTAAINAAAADATTKADKAKSDAIQAANAATDQKLVNYSTTTEMNSAINVKADAIEQSVAATYTTKAEFENLNVGGINYLLGTQKMKGWTKGTGATVDDTGEYAIATLIGSSSNWSSSLTVSPTRDISILDGSSFTFSMLYSTMTDTMFYVTIASTARTPGSASGSRTKYATFRSQTIPSTDGAWKTWSYTVDNITPEFMTSGSGDQNSWYITVYCRTQDAELKIQKLKFEKGNRATDWSPAPEDISKGAIDYTNEALTSYTTKTELASSLETTTEGILGTVSETYTTKTEFANLEIGGRNYLQFSDDPESWGWYTPTEYAVAKIFLYSNLVKEKKYTLTVYGQAPTRSDKTDCTYYACWGGANVNLGRIRMNNGRGVLTFAVPNSEHADTQNAWIQIYNTPPKGASGTTYSAEITKVKLEEGDKATDWTPAPEDIEHEFTVQKQAILDITSDEITAAVTKSEEGQPIINLLPSVYFREAASKLPYTAGGVTWTVNTDGSVTAQLADGATKATANSYFTLTGNRLTESPPVLMVNPSKKHVFYGCPAGGSSTTYRMGVQKWTEDNPPTGADGSVSYDYGSGVKLAAGFKWLYLYCSIMKNYAFPDGPVTFYPMLEVGQIAHGYVSSHNGSGTLTERIKSAEASISVQADQIASKVSTTDYNGNKIASLINQNATTIQINAQKIDLQGAVSFASFDTATKDALVTNTTTKNQYAQSTSDTTAPTSGWGDTIPVYSASKKYIWTRVSTTKTYAGGKSETTTSTPTVDKNLSSAIEAAASAQSTANSAVGTTKSTQQYYLSTSATSATGGSWADTVPTWAENKYVWTRMKTESTQKDGTALTPVYSTAVYDKNLTTALSTAASAQSTANSSLGSTQSSQQYYLSTSATSATGGTWLDTVPTWEANKYVWTRTKTGGVQKDGTIVPETYSTAVYDKNLTTALSTATSASTAAGTAQTTANGAVKSTSVKTQYYLSTSASSATGGSWVDTVPTWEANKYVWTRVVTTTTPVSGSASTTYTPSQNGTYDVNTTKALSDAASLAEGISAINLVPIVYNAEAAYGTKRTTNGITFEVLGNGHIKVTGTATAVATFYIAGTGLTSAVPQITLDPTKAYTFSGCPAGGSGSTYSLRANFYAENSGTSAVLRTDTGSGYTQAAQYYGASLYIRIENGYACPTDGLIFKPMFEVGKVKHNYVSSRSGVQGLSAKAIKATVSCYYRSTTQTPPAIDADTTISGTAYNKDDAWTYLLPQPSKGKYFYTCERYTYADGSVSFSTVREMTNLSVTSAWCSANDRTLIDGASIFTGSITADKITVADLRSFGATIGGFSIGENKLSTSNVITFYASNYTEDDRVRLTKILVREIEPTEADYEKYDIDGDGVLDVFDLVAVRNFVLGTTTSRTLTINAEINNASTKDTLKISTIAEGSPDSGIATRITSGRIFTGTLHLKDAGAIYFENSNNRYISKDAIWLDFMSATSNGLKLWNSNSSINFHTMLDGSSYGLKMYPRNDGYSFSFDPSIGVGAFGNNNVLIHGIGWLYNNGYVNPELKLTGASNTLYFSENKGLGVYGGTTLKHGLTWTSNGAELKLTASDGSYFTARMKTGNSGISMVYSGNKQLGLEPISGLVFKDSSGKTLTSYPSQKFSKTYTASHANLVFGGTSTVTVTKWGHIGFVDVNVLINPESTFNTETDYVICTLDAAYKPSASVRCMTTNGVGNPVLIQVTASGAVALYRYAGSSWSSGWIRMRIPLEFLTP